MAAFRRRDVDAAFFGGLSGVQVRLLLPGSVLLAKRDLDERFRRVFVLGAAPGCSVG